MTIDDAVPATAGPVRGADSGRLTVRAERVGRRTVLTECYRSVPFHLGRPSDRAGDGSAELIVQSVGPGYLPGDRLAIDIAVGPGATLTVRGQGATRVFPSADGTAAEARVTLTVAAGGRLTYLPGELIPYRDAVLVQTTTVNVAEGGALALGEIVTPGRVAMGEVDRYTRLRLDVDIAVAGRRRLLERARLEPAAAPLTSAGRHGPHPVGGTLHLVGDGWALPPVPEPGGAVTWSAGRADSVTLVRLLGPNAQSVSAMMAGLIPTRRSADPPESVAPVA